MKTTGYGIGAICAAWPATASPALAQDPPAVPAAARKAVEDYLRAEGKAERAALEKALATLKDDVAVAAEALASHAPLAAAKPGTRHGLTLQSGGRSWGFPIRLPEGYDGKKRFPVLVLPDHGAVDPQAGIRFWEGKDGSEEYVLFRPVILKYQEDADRFSKAQFLVKDAPIARVMADALAHLRLHYAVDPDRFAMTGLSQAGFYTWYYAVSFPDQFAAIVPESAGGVAQRALVANVARNLVGISVRILHAEQDQVCPYADAVRMRDLLTQAGGKVELITYTDRDYPGGPFPNHHPGPHHLRLKNVLPWAREQKRVLPASFTRILRYPQQGLEGRFRVSPPSDATRPLTVAFSEGDGGVLSCDAPGAVYLVSPQDVVAKRVFRVGGKEVRPKADLRLLLTSFKALGDPSRMAAAEIPLGR